MSRNRPNQRRDEVAVWFLQSHLGRRSVVVQWLKENLGIQLHSRATLGSIPSLLREEATGRLFAKKRFPDLSHLTFDQLCDVYLIAQGIGLYWSNEFGAFVEALRSHGHPDLLKRGQSKPREEQVNEVLKLVAYEECQAAIGVVALDDKAIRPVHQDGRFVVGPSGVGVSATNRKASQAEALLGLLRRVAPEHLHHLADILGFTRRASSWGPRNEKPFRLKLCEAALLDSSDNEIIEALNRLVEAGDLKPNSIEQLSGYMLTPYGVFPRSYGGDEELARLLQDKVDAAALEPELAALGLTEGPLALRVLEMCLLRAPEIILADFFNNFQLRALAKDRGLVSVGKAEKDRLIEVLVWKLGFSRPPKIQGLAQYRDLLKTLTLELRVVSQSLSERIGTMSRAYTATEGLLKDILRFYCSLRLKAADRLPPEREAQIADIEKFVHDDLDVATSTSDMTLGTLLEAIHKLDNLSRRDGPFTKALQTYFGRDSVLPAGVLEPLRAVQRDRRFFVHDVEVNFSPAEIPGPDRCREIAASLQAFAIRVREQSVYPLLVRIVQSVRDEYGRRYVEVATEDGASWRVKSPELWLEEGAYFMQPITNPIAMHPLLVEKVA